MRQFFVWKLFDRVLAPFEQSYIELVAFLALCALATAALAIRRGRQTWRFIVQLVSLIVFFFVVSSCLGVFGLIRNAIMGLGLLAAQDDLSAFFWMNMTLVALGAAFVGGAVFCGWICPTGALQEWAGWLARRLGLTPNNNAKMRTGALAVWVAVVAAYLVVAYAVFGKRRPILEDSATLWAGALSVLVAMVLLAPRHSPALKRFRAVSLLLILGFTVAGISVFSPVHFIFMNVQDRASMLSALAIVGAGFFVLRAWCRYLCPFGLVCGWAARHAVFQIAKGETCARCGTCERVCEMEAVHTGKVCVSDCIACMKCVDHCPEQALSLVARPFGDTKEAAPNGRTAAISAMVARSALVLFFACWTAAPASGASVEVLWNGFRGGPDAIAWRECGNAGTSEPCATWTFRPSNVTWNYSPGQTMWSSPAVAEIGNRVVCFVGCYDHNVYAIDVATGREVWRYPTGNGVYSTPAIVRVDGRDCLLVSSSDRTLYCLDAQKGTKIWAYEVYEWRQSLGRAFLASPIIVTASDGPSVILVSWAYDTAPKRVNEVAEIRALSPQDGRLRWKRIFAENRPTHPVAGLIGGGPRIYVGASDGNLYCLDGNDGSEVWRGAFKFPVEGAPAWVAGRDDGPPPLVLVGSRFGDLRAFDAASGETVWTFKTGGWILATPAVVS
ncbi:PQQ-binding-like beta-propeller repeat protein, partial [Candidatus Sumerlaeota bacterium]|nr:PQQ-binding-like beta-propeller repeat protein [Candidatus Sumerlaeota bacterium]